jgi:hypothetical protein
MKNYAIIDYDSLELHLFFKGESFIFDLTKGDVNEFIYGFETKDGKVYDINYSNSEFDEAGVCVYGIAKDEFGFSYVDTSDYTPIKINYNHLNK